MSRLLRAGAAVVLVGLLAGCAVFTVDADELQRGSADGMSFRVPGRPSYDRVWEAARQAVSRHMNIVYSHKPSGTIRARAGSSPSGKVLALFIAPTDARAPQYSIELVARAPMGMGQPVRHHPEYALVAQDFQLALEGR